MGQINYESDGQIPNWLFHWVLKHIRKVEIKDDSGKWAIWRQGDTT